MIVRAYRPEDLEEVRQIHLKYFKNEFDFPDFMDYLSAIVVEDEKGIVLAGGIRDICECITVTDQSRPVIERAAALRELLQFGVFATTQLEYDQMYVWSRNPSYTKRLKKCGFRESDAQSLILDL